MDERFLNMCLTPPAECGCLDRETLYFIEEYNQILTTFLTKVDEVPSELTEKFLRSSGVVAFGHDPEDGGKIVPFLPAFGGDLSFDGIGTHIEGVTLNGHRIEGERGKDIAVIFNNGLYMPDAPFLKWYANMFSEADKSIRSNLLMSRLMPLGLATDEQTKKTIESAYKKVLDGELYAIAKVNNIIDDEAFKTSDITNVDNIAKIQYLSKFVDDLTRRLYVKYGIPISSNAKMAQTNEGELQGYEFYSQIYLNDCFEMRKRGIEDVNRIFGEGTGSVVLSKPFYTANTVALKEDQEQETETVEEVIDKEEKTDGLDSDD